MKRLTVEQVKAGDQVQDLATGRVGTVVSVCAPNPDVRFVMVQETPRHHAFKVREPFIGSVD